MVLIHINSPILGDEEKNEVMKVLESSQLTTASPDGGIYTQKFQDSVKTFLDVEYAFAVNSGTSALISSLLALGVKAGDEVLLPSFTFLATVNSVLLIGAKPVFVDIELNHYTIDPEDLTKKISNKSVAVIPVHLYGHPADMANILEIGEKNDIPIIEDAAQSLGAVYNKRQTGTIGDIGCFSMYPSKIITCGEGGFVTTNDDDLAERLKLIRNHGIKLNYDAVIPGARRILHFIPASIKSLILN
ncbi:DegT/DnrJ/EryC1/StrS family aminotransferase, partial [Thermoproteota archaeon]